MLKAGHWLYLVIEAALVRPAPTGLHRPCFHTGKIVERVRLAFHGGQPKPQGGSETNASDGHRVIDSECLFPPWLTVLGSSSSHMAPGTALESTQEGRDGRGQEPSSCSQGQLPLRGLLSPSHKQLSDRLAPSRTGLPRPAQICLSPRDAHNSCSSRDRPVFHQQPGCMWRGTKKEQRCSVLQKDTSPQNLRL